MAILDKHGKIYRLRGPNPLMQEQKTWNMNKVVLINMNNFANLLSVADDKDVEHIVKEKKSNYSKEVSEQPGENTIKKQNEEYKQKKPSSASLKQTNEKVNIDRDVKERIDRLLKEKGVLFYCAIPVSEEYTDELYGEKYVKHSYRDYQLIKCIIVYETDLKLKFWSSREIVVGSILMKKDKQGGERWWKAHDVEKDEYGYGYLVQCVPSDVQPHFS